MSNASNNAFDAPPPHDNGGPAFPAEIITGVAYDYAQRENVHATQPTPGMTLRDFFAAKAMQGLLASPGSDGWFGDSKSNDADYCYRVADAMLKARAS